MVAGKKPHKSCQTLIQALGQLIKLSVSGETLTKPPKYTPMASKELEVQ